MSYPEQTTGLGVATTLLCNYGQILSVSCPVALNVGGTHSITPTLIDTGGNLITPTSSFTYTSNNAGIASVNSSGTITANAVGNCAIQVSYAGIYAIVSVAVISAVPSQPPVVLAGGNSPAKYFLLPQTIPGLLPTPLTFSCW